ncbi:hypothetical protein F4553_001797 [Allocatelliglobosispora scoriae]|uniref:Uncharacterized protein n=1 Tax=Allocatelliglobosispora scoriae TaxID=643052 RepID=A0A841BM36_9ACTN|nr:DUF6308 family protein [Allocatelliglobosispora scoriae]MBB5868418.1 hypothetical protein [Allocatelliglobosispora scoriae]
MHSEDLLRVRIRDVLAVPDIERLVAAYFDPNKPFAGTSFDLLGENPPDMFTLDDLLATTLLDISWRPLAIRTLLAGGGHLTAGLATLPTDLDLWNASPDILRSAGVLHQWLDKLPGVGPVIASKLLARKRPRLVPIHDSVVLRVLAPPENQFWTTLATALTESTLRSEIEALRPSGVDSPSLLRLLDVAIWTCHSRARNARKARGAVGITEPGPVPPVKS